jgi:predicted nucleic acid-binding protein
MADHFFDTSGAVKHYRAEVGTTRVDGILAEAGSRHFLSSVGVVEVHSVLARLVRTGEITAAEFNAVRGRFLADVASGLWQIVQVTGAELQQAQQLLVQYATRRSLRTLDAIQLAVAQSLHASSPLDDFVCADAHLCQVAAAEGLTAVNPEIP